MKLMIASDIHGSAFYCEQMIEAYKREGADKLLLLGDILYHGPRICQEIRKKRTVMLQYLQHTDMCIIHISFRC